MSNLHHQHHHRLCRSPIEREQRDRTEKQQQLQEQPTGQEYQWRARRQQQQPVREQSRAESQQKEQHQQQRRHVESSPSPRLSPLSPLSSPPECRQRSTNRRPEIVYVPDDGALSAALTYDGYQLGTTVGHGSYSKVRIAVKLRQDERHASTAQRVACKVIDKRRQAGGSSQYVLKFLPRELDVLQSVRHPNVVRTHRIYVAPSSVLVFMDYCELGDLLSHLQHSKTMPQWQAHMFFRQICDAVDYLHRNNISHRDIKCENVLLESMRQIKLTDFGFARMCSDERGRRVMSQTYCGSSFYAAPEVLQGIPYDPKAYDVWALGVVLYVMLADCMPYPSANRQQIVANQMAKKFNKPKKIVSREAQKLFSIILEPDVSKRATVSQIKRHPWVSQPNQFHTLTR